MGRHLPWLPAAAGELQIASSGKEEAKAHKERLRVIREAAVVPQAQSGAS